MSRPPAFPTGQLVRIGILVVLLVAVVVMKSRCGPAAESMFKALEPPKNADGGLTSPDTARK
ncbi:MAG: hypothetical protein JWM53_4055 [bacterium]|nr:hypothetical protein [bacterium]